MSYKKQVNVALFVFALATTALLFLNIDTVMAGIASVIENAKFSINLTLGVIAIVALVYAAATHVTFPEVSGE